MLLALTELGPSWWVSFPMIIVQAASRDVLRFMVTDRTLMRWGCNSKDMKQCLSVPKRYIRRVQKSRVTLTWEFSSPICRIYTSCCSIYLFENDSHWSHIRRRKVVLNWDSDTFWRGYSPDQPWENSREISLTHLITVDALYKSPRPLCSLDGSLKYSINVNMVAFYVIPWTNVLWSGPTDQDTLIELSLQCQLPRCWY